jgi:hypothetical protein
MTPALSLLHRLELTLWQAETRFDSALMDRTFAPDLIEFGRSGRRYRRDQMLFDASERQEMDATLHDFTTRVLSADLAQCTYVSEVRRPDGTEWANRSSIWDRSSGNWQLRFHQGTAIPEGLHP